MIDTAKLKAEIKRIKSLAYGALNTDYATGCLCTLNSLEGFIADLEKPTTQSNSICDYCSNPKCSLCGNCMKAGYADFKGKKVIEVEE